MKRFSTYCEVLRKDVLINCYIEWETIECERFVYQSWVDYNLKVNPVPIAIEAFTLLLAKTLKYFTVIKTVSRLLNG
jgi:hypothetical protein